MKIKPICPEEESKEMSEQERELDVPEEVSGKDYRVKVYFFVKLHWLLFSSLGSRPFRIFPEKVGVLSQVVDG